MFFMILSSYAVYLLQFIPAIALKFLIVVVFIFFYSPPTFDVDEEGTDDDDDDLPAPFLPIEKPPGLPFIT